MIQFDNLEQLTNYRIANSPHVHVLGCRTILYKSGNLIYHSSVVIATSWTARVRFPVVQDFSPLHSVQTGSRAHPASYPIRTGGKPAEA
jgi:hypothetical protein